MASARTRTRWIFRIRDCSSVLKDAPRPEKPLVLHEYDASPYCKRVREMIHLLDLTVEYRPCPALVHDKASFRNK